MLSHWLQSMTALPVRSILPGLLLGLVALACAPSPRTPPREAGQEDQQAIPPVPAPPVPAPLVPAVPVAAPPVPAPLVLDGACEGEDCMTRFAALACADTDLRATASDSAPVVARVSAGDTVEVTRSDLHVLRKGLVVVRDTVTLSGEDLYLGDDSLGVSLGDSLRFVPGDTLHLLRYLGLGAWHWLRHGRLEGGMEFWAGPVGGRAGGAMHKKDSTRAVALSHPVVGAWWLVTLPGGTTGWWRADGGNELRSILDMERWMELRCAGPDTTAASAPAARAY